MGPGLFLIVIGLIFALAVRQDPKSFSLHTMGWILTFAGFAALWNAWRVERKQKTSEHRVDHYTEEDADGISHDVETETYVQSDPDDH